jgi:hypothetical protein
LARLDYRIAPRMMRAGMAAMMKTYLAQASRSPVTDGNLLRPMAEGRDIEGLAYRAGAGRGRAGAYSWVDGPADRAARRPRRGS